MGNRIIAKERLILRKISPTFPQKVDPIDPKSYGPKRHLLRSETLTASCPSLKSILVKISPCYIKYWVSMKKKFIIRMYIITRGAEVTPAPLPQPSYLCATHVSFML